MTDMQTFKEYLVEAEEQQEQFKTDFEVPVHNIEWLKKRVEKLNKTAAKLNVKPIQLSVGDVFTRMVKEATADRPAVYMDFHNVHVEGETPKLNGWSFVGKLEPLEGSNEIMAKTAPGAKQLPKKYQHVDHIECEHCGHDRYRKESFIVKKGSSYKQVGRSCLKDFLGHADPKKIADWSEVLYDIETALTPDGESDYGSSGFGFSAADTDMIIARSMVEIRKNGFKSKQYSDHPTSVTVIDSFFPPKYPNIKGMTAKEWFDSFKIETTEADLAKAKEARQWMIANGEKSSNEFDINTSKILKGDVVSTKNFGYVVAGANNYLKVVDGMEAKKGMKASIKDEHIGAEGDKHKLQGEVIFKHVYQGQSYSYYHTGMKAILMIKTTEGHLVKMFSSNLDIEKGDSVEISGKIGRHEIENYEKSPFKGMKVTIMGSGSRIKQVEK